MSGVSSCANGRSNGWAKSAAHSSTMNHQCETLTERPLFCQNCCGANIVCIAYIYIVARSALFISECSIKKQTI